MSAVSGIQEAAAKETAVKSMDSLENNLLRLAQFGEPTMHKMKSGWWVTLNLHVAGIGTSIRIESESSCKTPTDAARQCEERLKEMLSKLPRT
jgi:hypothetical protein